MRREGIPAGAIRFEQYADLKYDYQLQELGVAFPVESGATNLPDKLSELFRRSHEQAFGYNTEDAIELVRIRLRALASASSMQFSELSAKIATAYVATRGEPRQAYFGAQYGAVKAASF